MHGWKGFEKPLFDKDFTMLGGAQLSVHTGSIIHYNFFLVCTRDKQRILSRLHNAWEVLSLDQFII